MATSCKECGSLDLVDDRQSGDCICTGCGLVIEDHAWESYNTSAEPLVECSTRQVIANCPRRFLQAGRDRRTNQDTAHLRKVAGDLGLTDGIVSSAIAAWEQITAKHTCRGEVRVGLAAACVFFSCKLSGFPRSKQLVATAYGLSPASLKKAMKVYTDCMEPSRRDVLLMCSSTDSKDVMSSCVSMAVGDLVPFDLERNFLAEARKIDAAVHGSGVLEGKTPHVVAAACVSIAMLRRKMAGRETLFKHLKVSQHTLSRTLGLIKNHTNIIP